MAVKETFYCEKCGRTMDGEQFYNSRNLEKYPNKKLHQCKNCITLHVDNWDPETFMWILEEVDVPYIPDVWNDLLQKAVTKYKDNPEKITGKTVLGGYLRTMALKQHKNERFADSERIAKEREEEKRRVMRLAGYVEEDIQRQIDLDHSPARPELSSTVVEDYSSNFVEPIKDELMDELTEEDITYLRLKWGSGYRADEWVQMEQLYNDMTASYDIQTAGHKDTLKMLCKTSLKANQLIDASDIEGFQKMQKAYDSLMKAGKFTAAQMKETEEEYVDCVGNLVALCEKEGFIPRYYVDGPQDKIDKILLDYQTYTQELVAKETNLNNMIDNALEAIARDREKELDLATEEDYYDEDEVLEKSLFEDNSVKLTSQDYIDFAEFEEGLEEELEGR